MRNDQVNTGQRIGTGEGSEHRGRFSEAAFALRATDPSSVLQPAGKRRQTGSQGPAQGEEALSTASWDPRGYIIQRGWPGSRAAFTQNYNPGLITQTVQVQEAMGLGIQVGPDRDGANTLGKQNTLGLMLFIYN